MREVVCAKLHAALGSPEGLDSEPWRRVNEEAIKAGWPQNALELARDAATTPRGKIYDAADGRGGRGITFRSRIPSPLRYDVDLWIDLLILGGDRKPSMIVRRLAHLVREAARVHGDTPPGRELRALADLFEQYPAEAVDYAAEWAIHFDKRIGGPR